MAKQKEHQQTEDMEAGRQVAIQEQGGALVEYDYGDDAGAGMENVDRSEYRIAFITVLQSNSPQCEEGSPKYNPAAKAGMFMNSVTGELYDGKKGLLFVPCYRNHNYVEYTPRELGGGFLGAYDPSDPAIEALIADFNKRRNKPPKTQVFGKLSTTSKWSSDNKPLDGTEFTETFYLFGLVAAEGETPYPVMLAFKSTQIAKYQNVVMRYQRFKYNNAGLPDPQGKSPPLWAHKWRLTTAPEQRKGKTFQGINLRLWELNADGSEKPSQASLMKPNDPLYIEAKALRESIVGGGVKANYDTRQAESEAGGVADDEDVPM